jgi:hypothetical protein
LKDEGTTDEEKDEEDEEGDLGGTRLNRIEIRGSKSKSKSKTQ